MAHRAAHVIKLIEELRRLSLPDNEYNQRDITSPGSAPTTPTLGNPTSAPTNRPPKRPWEDDEAQIPSQGGGSGSEYNSGGGGGGSGRAHGQTMAEKDMAMIRSKRASNANGQLNAGGVPKGKYRKRSVSLFFFFFRLVEIGVANALVESFQSSEPHRQGNVIRVIYAKHLSGGVDLMEREPCVMRVDYVSSNSRFFPTLSIS